jgi:CBS domain-containing protein
MRLRDVMLASVPQVSAGASVQQALDQIGTAGEAGLIVMDQKEVVGVVSDGDLRAVPESDRYERKVRNVLHAVAPLSPDSTIKEAANLLRSHNLERAPIAEDGHLVGVITVGRLLELIGRGAVHAPPNRERVVLAKRGNREHKPDQKQPPKASSRIVK